MARHKSSTKKEQLVHEKRINRKAPVWVYLKTKDRGKMRERNRQWKSHLVGKKLKKKAKKSNKKKKVKVRRHG